MSREHGKYVHTHADPTTARLPAHALPRCGRVIGRARKFQSERTNHGRNLLSLKPCCQDLTPSCAPFEFSGELSVSAGMMGWAAHSATRDRETARRSARVPNDTAEGKGVNRVMTWDRQDARAI